MIDRAKYPELAKLDDLHTQQITVADFLDWLSENKLFVAQYIVPEGWVNEHAVPIHEMPEVLIARYLGIDLNAVERERRALLATIVPVAAGVGDKHGD